MSLYLQVVREVVLIDEVTGITVSDVIQDPATGKYVRRLLIFTDPPNAVNKQAALEIDLQGQLLSAVQITLPSSLKF